MKTMDKIKYMLAGLMFGFILLGCSAMLENRDTVQISKLDTHESNSEAMIGYDADNYVTVKVTSNPDGYIIAIKVNSGDTEYTAIKGKTLADVDKFMQELIDQELKKLKKKSKKSEK